MDGLAWRGFSGRKRKDKFCVLVLAIMAMALSKLNAKVLNSCNNFLFMELKMDYEYFIRKN